MPFEEDPTLGKDRPVVIIGRHGDDLSGVALTSKRTGHATHVEVGTGAWDPKGRPSYAKVDRLLDIEPSSVRREGAVAQPPPLRRRHRSAQPVPRRHPLTPARQVRRRSGAEAASSGGEASYLLASRA